MPLEPSCALRRMDKNWVVSIFDSFSSQLQLGPGHRFSVVVCVVVVGLVTVFTILSSFIARLLPNVVRRNVEADDNTDRTLDETDASPGAAEVKRPLHKYDVFINHRGPDTKKTFVAHLNEALCNAGFHPFLDAKAIQQGSHVFTSIDEALAGACVHVAVFSKAYAESKYCLQELCQMVQSQNVILPVFYDVQPEHLRYTDSGPFAEGFRKHRRRGRLKEIEKWKGALREVADRRGFRMDEVSGDEQQLVRSIVVAVHNQMPVNLEGEKRRFGLEESLSEVLEMFDSMGDSVGILGLHGTGGIGKTTLADELYRRLLARGGYKASFLKDARSSTSLGLQRQLVRDLIQEECMENSNMYRPWFSRLRTQRVLVVVDDIDNVTQFTDLILDFELYPGCRIVVTSRHRDVLNRSMGLATHKALHEVKVLNSVHSRQIFNWHAFLSEVPSKEFRDLAEKVADACGGHPLALEVIGASLYDKKDLETDRSVWMDAIKTLKENGEVLDKLRISYDSLRSDGDKAMFRDIACLLIGMREEVALEIWKSCESCSDVCSTTKGPDLVLRRLVDKSLVRVRDGVLSMHDVIRDMGRDIVMKEVPKERAGKRTHLWDATTAAKVLSRNQGTDRVRGLTLSAMDSFSTATYAAAQFASLCELHLLVLDGCAVEGGDFSSLSQELRWLQWRWFPCTELPSHLKLPKVAVLDLTDSIRLSRLWQEDALVEFPWLQRLILKNCRLIEELPQNLGHKLPRLRTLDLRNCSLIVVLPDSVGQLKNLEHFTLSYCRELTTLPNAIVNLTKLKTLVLRGCISLERLPVELGSLINLEYFDLTRCLSLLELPLSVSGLRKLKELRINFTHDLTSLPDGFGQLTSLHTLDIMMCCNVNTLPQSFEGLTALVFLDLGGCNLEGWLPSYFGAFTALKTLKLGANRKLVGIEALPQSLQHLDMSDCSKLMHLPSLAGMSSLKFLDLRDCKSLTGVEGLEFLTALEVIYLRGCTSMVSSNLQIVQNTTALRGLSGSKVGVSYNNTWSEKEPALQLISYYGHVMGFLVDGIGRRNLRIEINSMSLLMHTTISSRTKCTAVIICVVARNQNANNHCCALEAWITRDNMEVMNGSKLCESEAADQHNRVYLTTLRRQHTLVQSLKFGDKIFVYARVSSGSSTWQGTVEEGAICVIHGENDDQLISMNSRLLNKTESKELSTNLGELVLADYAHSSLDGSLQYLNTGRTEFAALHNTEVFEHQGAWTIPPRYGEFMFVSRECDSWYLPRAGRGIISFTAEGENDVSIEIADPTWENGYRIIIGGNGNSSTCVRRKTLYRPWWNEVCVVARGLLHPKLANRLWVSMDERTSIIQVGRGEPGKDVISHYMDPKFNSTAQRVSFTTHNVPITYSNILFMDLDQHIQALDLSYQLQEELQLEPVMTDKWTIVPLTGQYSWAHYWELPSIGSGVISFETDSHSHLCSHHIAISARPRTMNFMYAIVIDEEGTTIRRASGGPTLCSITTEGRRPQISKARRYWVSIDERTKILQVGEGDPCQANTFFSWKDPDFLSESLYLTFTTGLFTVFAITYSNVRIGALPSS